MSHVAWLYVGGGKGGEKLGRGVTGKEICGNGGDRLRKRKKEKK